MTPQTRIDTRISKSADFSTAFRELARRAQISPYDCFERSEGRIDARLATIGHTLLRAFGADLCYDRLFRIIIKGEEIENWEALVPHDKETLINLGAYVPVGLRSESDFQQISKELVAGLDVKLRNNNLSNEIKEALKTGLAQVLADFSSDLPLHNGIKKAYLPGLSALYAEQELHKSLGWLGIFDTENTAVRPRSTKNITEFRVKFIESLVKSLPDLEIISESAGSIIIPNKYMWNLSIYKEGAGKKNARQGDTRRYLISYRNGAEHSQARDMTVALEDVYMQVPSHNRKRSDLCQLFDPINLKGPEEGGAFIVDDKDMKMHQALACGISDLKIHLDLYPYSYALSFARIDLSTKPIAILSDPNQPGVIYFQYPIAAQGVANTDRFFIVRVDESTNNANSYVATVACMNDLIEYIRDQELQTPEFKRKNELISLKQYFESKKV